MDFIAMDFETANRKRASACSLALVVVQQNKVVDSFYTLINPQMQFDAQNIHIHGITLKWFKISQHLIKFGRIFKCSIRQVGS